MFPDLIYDIGMHVGEDTVYYLRKGYRVLAIEANPLLVQQNTRKFAKAIAEKRLTILNVGVSDHEGILPFYVNHRLTEWSSFDKEMGTRNGTSYGIVEVPCVRTAQLFEQYGIPFYMKVDIEGFDFYPLQDIPDEADKPRFVSCEAVHLSWLDILRDKGYTKFKLIHQGYKFIPFDPKREQNPLFPKWQLLRNGIQMRLQRFLPFEHLYGSSGPFGNETKGPWLSYQEVKDAFDFFYGPDKSRPLNPVSWFDFHATY